jgi:formylglycine-generating enzyme required for sulfatase activity
MYFSLLDKIRGIAGIEHKYDVFISYSQEDTAIAEQICVFLEKVGISYFIDKKRIEDEKALSLTLKKAIQESTLFLFLGSVNAQRSVLATNEVKYAFKKKDREQIVLCIIDQCEFPEELQFTLSDINYQIFQEDSVDLGVIFGLLKLLGREQKITNKTKEEVEEESLVVKLPGEVDLELIKIEPGKFMMGSPKDEFGKYKFERRRKVTITKGYWLGKYSVTQAQYKAVMGENPSNKKDYKGVYHGVGDNYPVYNVSWFDAMKFCEKLTKIEKAAKRLPKGYKYTLPTEAQWEYACRAGTTTALNNGKNIILICRGKITSSDEKNYVVVGQLSKSTSSSGKNILFLFREMKAAISVSEKNILFEECAACNLSEVAWYRDNSDDKAHPVGLKAANAWGLYDMHGNVEEWCLDWFANRYEESDTTGLRVKRGGGWDTQASFCRSAVRHDSSPDAHWMSGFRLALVPVQ